MKRSLSWIFCLVVSLAVFRPVDAQNEVVPTCDSTNCFKLCGPEYDGEYAMFHLSFRYGGVTKVKLRGTDDEILWGDQYMDDKGDKRTLKFRTKCLDPKRNYTVEFEHNGKFLERLVVNPRQFASK